MASNADLLGPVLVTGVTGAIGTATALCLLAEGFVVIGQTRDADRISDELSKAANFSAVVSDLNVDSVGEWLKSIVSEFGPLRGFVHCAGQDKVGPLFLNKAGTYRDLLEVHAIFPMLAVGELTKKGMADTGCSVVLISSLSASSGAAGRTAYAAAKGAIEGFLRSAALEVATKHIRINVATPGVVDSPMAKAFLQRMGGVSAQKIFESYPLGIGSPSDVAEAICFLISDKAKWITGQNLILDGGASLGS